MHFVYYMKCVHVAIVRDIVCYVVLAIANYYCDNS